MKNLTVANTKPLALTINRASWALFYRRFQLPGMPAAEAGPAMIWMQQADYCTVTSRLVEIAKNERSHWGHETGIVPGEKPRVMSLDPFESQSRLTGDPLPKNLHHVQWRGGGLPKTRADVISVFQITHYFPRRSAQVSAQLLFEEIFGGGAIYDLNALNRKR